MLSRYHTRIRLVFLPIRSPKLNLIEEGGPGFKERLSTIVCLEVKGYWKSSK